MLKDEFAIFVGAIVFLAVIVGLVLMVEATAVVGRGPGVGRHADSTVTVVHQPQYEPSSSP